MVTTRQARRALKHTNQLIGPLFRDGDGWTFQEWFATKQVWVKIRRPTSYRAAARYRKQVRIATACLDLGIIGPLHLEGRAESIVASLSRYPSPWKKAA